MEDTDTVVPLRPGFDIQVRGFNREQVTDHVDLLENQLKLVTIDRNEAVQLNTDLRKLCEDTRNDLAEAEERLRRIESSDTGLPAASQRVQNMLSIAEEEVQSLRDRAKRQAEIIRGGAETDARELITEAERKTEDLRGECTRLLENLEERRDEVRREHAQALKDLREREERLRHSVRDAYKRAMAIAQQESDELLDRTRAHCAELQDDTDQRRREAHEEIRAQEANVANLRASVLSAMGRVRDSLETSAEDLHTSASEISNTAPEAGEHAPVESGQQPALRAVQVPEPREDLQTFVFPMDGANPNGFPTLAGDHDTVQRT